MKISNRGRSLLFYSRPMPAMQASRARLTLMVLAPLLVPASLVYAACGDSQPNFTVLPDGSSTPTIVRVIDENLSGHCSEDFGCDAGIGDIGIGSTVGTITQTQTLQIAPTGYVAPDNLPACAVGSNTAIVRIDKTGILDMKGGVVSSPFVEVLGPGQSEDAKGGILTGFGEVAGKISLQSATLRPLGILELSTFQSNGQIVFNNSLYRVAIGGSAVNYIDIKAGTLALTNAKLLLEFPSNFSATIGQVFTLVKFSGGSRTGVLSQANGAALSEGAILAANGINLKLTYVGGAGGKDILLTAQNGTANPAPTFSSFSPTVGKTGTLVTLNGTNFTGATAVKLHGVSAGPKVSDINAAASGFQIISATQIKAKVPANCTTGKFSVTTGAGTAVSVSNFLVDNVLPLSSIVTNPANGSAVKALAAMIGTASDNSGGSGLDKVNVYLRHKIGSNLYEYWSNRGGVWGWGASARLLGTVTSTGWIINSSSPAGTVMPTGANLPDGLYYIHANAFDKAGNYKASPVIGFAVDNTVPQSVAVTTPRSTTPIKTLTSLAGTANDNSGGSGIVKVEAILRRKVGTSYQYWGKRSGVWSWGAGSVRIPATVSGTNWSITASSPAGTTFPAGSNLPAGTYYVHAYAYDKAGNSKASPVINFTVSP